MSELCNIFPCFQKKTQYIGKNTRPGYAGLKWDNLSAF